ncbi:secretory lipase [Aspergillus sclerotialis]|uniref:Secretory lipase n=1 Tax=Aspergillus sclerotialis TaxID=2070753 RepID=A0A3A2ZNV9_9EURO|nr:secretory lipase [Aspergillus sclerotialis]
MAWPVPVVRLALVAFMALMVAFTSAAPAEPRGIPQKPADDPFYQPPEGFQNEAPGTVLRNRKIVAGFFGLLPNPIEAHQLLYRTTSTNGSAIAGATTIFKPWFPKKDRFVSFHTAYDSSATICNPSYTYQWGAPPTDLISSAEMLLIEAYLISGYIVVSPDYEGPDAAFTPGHLEGMGVLDNMRAVTNFREKLGLSTDKPMIVGAGYSGGAIATGWAASLQPSYAPELNIKGWVQGGTPSNLTSTLLLIDDSTFSGFIPAAVAGLTMPSTYGAELQPLMERILTDKGREALDFARSHCAVANLLKYPNLSLFSKDIQTMGEGLLEEPSIKSVLGKNIMGVNKDETPTAPVFAYHAKQDDIVPYDDASRMAKSWCDNGADVKFTTFAHGGHATTEIVALPDALNFVKAAFDGKTESGCSRNTELKSDLDPLALGVELEPILNRLIKVLSNLGKGDENMKNNLNVLDKTVSTS